MQKSSRYFCAKCNRQMPFTPQAPLSFCPHCGTRLDVGSGRMRLSLTARGRPNWPLRLTLYVVWLVAWFVIWAVGMFINKLLKVGIETVAVQDRWTPQNTGLLAGVVGGCIVAGLLFLLSRGFAFINKRSILHASRAAEFPEDELQRGCGNLSATSDNMNAVVRCSQCGKPCLRSETTQVQDRLICPNCYV